jgi:hypothetical protein
MEAFESNDPRKDHINSPGYNLKNLYLIWTAIVYGIRRHIHNSRRRNI